MKDPTKALEFDYSDVALPLVEFAAKNLESKMTEIDLLITKTQNELKQLSKVRFYKRMKLERQLNEYQVAQKFYKELASEAKTYLNAQQITYQKSIEFLYYFSRAYGHFESRQFSTMTQFYLGIDRAFQGYKQLSIEAEFARYQNRKFEIFQKPSAVKGFTISEKPYLEALQHPDVKASTENLNAILVPLYDSIGREFLMRFLSTEISIVGVTPVPVEADGFKRPSGDFWMHDIRHESARQVEIANFVKKHNMTMTQWQKFSSYQEKWYLEYKKHLALVEDKNLREAIELSSFNYFHDRGYPFVPSVWKSRKGHHVYAGLVLMLVLSGQGTGFKNIFSNSKKALTWLDSFFEVRAQEEKNAISQVLSP